MPNKRLLHEYKSEKRVIRKTSSSAMAERPRALGDFKKAQVNVGTDNHSFMDSHKCLRCR